MIKNAIILKSISYLILVVMFHMHVCSALCAAGGYGCCDKEEKDEQHSKKECCEHEKKSDSNDHDCQDMHLAFFSTTGQFSQVIADILLKAFQPLVAAVTPLLIIQPISESKVLFTYNGFHPPPFDSDTRIFIQSFQI